MKTNCPTKRMVLIYGSAVVILIIYGFWGDKIICILTNSYIQRCHPRMLVEFLTIALGIPTGLFINNLIEKERDKKILISIFTFIKTELVSNQKNIENLQHAAETINSLPDISQDDLDALGNYTSVLSQKSYVAAQSSTAFVSINDDVLMDSIINAYLNIQRMIGGTISFGGVEPEGRRNVLIAYIKLCERSEESIKACISKIDEGLRKVNKKLTITG